MMFDKHVEEFLAALSGERGELDAWLECNNEKECKSAMFGAIEKSANQHAEEITRLRQQVATLTEQRDLAVEALELAKDSLWNFGCNTAASKAEKTLAAIQSAEVTK